MKTKKPTKYKKTRSEPGVLREGAVAEWGRVVTVRDAKAHLSALLEWVAAGHELTITSDGQPKAKLIKAEARERGKVFQGMGDYLLKQPVHDGSAEEAVNWTRGHR